jgi:hypothetical protein
MTRIAGLALVAGVAMAAQTSHAAGIEVIDEGAGVFFVGLVLDPDEVVAGIQIEIAADGGTITEFGAAEWLVPLTGGLPAVAVNPWSLISTVAESPGLAGAALGVHAFNQGGDDSAGLTNDYDALVDEGLGSFAGFKDPSFVATSLPIARLTVDGGTVSPVLDGAICSAAAGSSCDLDEVPTPEPTAAVLVGAALAGLAAIRRR